MELRVLRYFVATAEELSFVRAAERESVSQPALGRQIADLERELGVGLFERTTRRVRLTPAGEVLLEHARVILTRVERAVLDAQRAGSGTIGTVRIGFLPTAMASVLPTIVAAFRAALPDIALTFEELLDNDQARRLAGQQLDVGFVRGVPPASGLVTEALFHEPFVAVLPESHPLAGADAIELHQLAHEQFLLWPRDQAEETYDQVIMACHRAGFTPRTVDLSGRSLAILGLVAANLGVSLLAASYANIHLAGVTCVPLTSDLTSTLKLAWHPGQLAPSAARFIDVARAVAATYPLK